MLRFEEKQIEILRIPIVEKKDAVLPAAFGKSSVYQVTYGTLC